MTTIKSGLITLLLCCIVSISFKPKEQTILKDSIIGRWTLIGFFPKKIDTFSHKELIVINIDKDGMTTGFLGCNKFRTTCKSYQDSIRFGTILYSRKFCNRTYMDMEDQLKTTLSKSNIFNVEEKTLILYEGKKKLASFKKVEHVHQP
jgi:hypothetical protein